MLRSISAVCYCASQFHFFTVADGACEQGRSSRIEVRELQVDLCNTVIIGRCVKNKRSEAGTEDLYHHLRHAHDLSVRTAAYHKRYALSFAAFESRLAK